VGVLGLLSFIFGMTSIVLGFIPFLGWLISLAAIILGIIALVRKGKKDNKWMPITGMAVGFVSLIIGLLIFFAVVIVDDEVYDSEVPVVYCDDRQIQVGLYCCDDLDANGICDEDEIVSLELREKYENIYEQEYEEVPSGPLYGESLDDMGDFYVSYPTTTQYTEWKDFLVSRQSFEDVAFDFNSFLNLPTDILISPEECGEVNAYYDPSQQKVSMCYELMDYFNDLFITLDPPNVEELNLAVLETTLFVFYHELGHALVDVLDLPVTGKEEDAVDQLASVIVIEGGNADSALKAATWFLLQSEQQSYGDLAFWDEHSLDEQRFFNILCWVYGSDTYTYADLVGEGGLPESRAARCPGEYQQMRNSWERLLRPYAKE
jgi:hypothetical protein